MYSYHLNVSGSLFIYQAAVVVSMPTHESDFIDALEHPPKEMGLPEFEACPKQNFVVQFKSIMYKVRIVFPPSFCTPNNQKRVGEMER